MHRRVSVVRKGVLVVMVVIEMRSPRVGVEMGRVSPHLQH